MPTFVLVRYRDGERLESGATLAAHAPLLCLDIEHGAPTIWPTVGNLGAFPCGTDVYVKTEEGWKFGVIARLMG